MRRAVVFTAFNRHEYLRQTLDSWFHVVGKENYDFHVSLEPSESNAKMRKVITDFANKAGVEVTIHDNETKLGVLVNPWNSFNRLFEQGYDFVVLAEDDIEVSSDILHYFKDLSLAHENDEEVLAVCASSYHLWKDSEDAAAYFKIQAFCPLVWGTWRHKWNSFLKDTWDKDYSTGDGMHSGWDWNISLRILPQNNMKCIYSRVSRSKHIGVDGVHMQRQDYEQSVAKSFNLHNSYAGFKEKPMNNTLLIVPTRGRPESVKEFYDEFINNTNHTDLIFGIDDDDKQDYPELEHARYEINPRMGMNGTLNYLANKYSDDYEYICFMGDDHRIRSRDWDLILVSEINGFGLAYGNDLLQGGSLPTFVMISSNIIKTLGFMAPPNQKHMYLDNFWLDLGTKLNAITYKDNVIVEHLHFSKTGQQMDQTYQETNNDSVYSSDKKAYEKYKSTKMDSDVEKILKCVNA